MLWFTLPSFPPLSTMSGLPCGKAVAYFRVSSRNKEAVWPPSTTLVTAVCFQPVLFPIRFLLLFNHNLPVLCPSTLESPAVP